jgi:hypothetical protein
VQQTSHTVFLVNLDNAALYGGPVTAIRPVGTQHVRVRLDPVHQVRRVHLLGAGADASWVRDSDGTVGVTVPSVTDLEAVAIDLA